jgi:hypothetical protein
MLADGVSTSVVQVGDHDATHWKRQLHQFAGSVCKRLRQRPDVAGIAIGGSLARGVEWRHSDVEIGIVVRDRIADLGHFNVIDGRGVEVFQFVQAEWQEQLWLAHADPSVVAKWPIQMYQCRIIRDAAGIFSSFKEQFDATLFQPAIVAAHRNAELAQFDEWFARGQVELQSGFPVSALVSLRIAFNSLILAYYWHHGILPRSQNRTDALLRAHCRRLGHPDFYHLFRDVYALRVSARRARMLIEPCRADIDAAVAVWGVEAPAFFRYAVDGNFEWGIAGSILTVHRLCVPLYVRTVQGQEHIFDDASWSGHHAALCTFLGLSGWQPSGVTALFERTAVARAALPVQVCLAAFGSHCQQSVPRELEPVQ